MTNIPATILNTFFHFLKKDIPIQTFEDWVYQSEELQIVLGEDLYLDLISLNYHSKEVYYLFRKFISACISESEYITWLLRIDLLNAKNRSNDYHQSILNFYDFHCNGLTFLFELAYQYSQNLCSPRMFGYIDYCDLTFNQKEKIVNEFYPEIISHLDDALNWINNKEIVITSQVSEFGQYEFLDDRS